MGIKPMTQHKLYICNTCKKFFQASPFDSLFVSEDELKEHTCRKCKDKEIEKDSVIVYREHRIVEEEQNRETK
jgi:hypothetical protein